MLRAVGEKDTHFIISDSGWSQNMARKIRYVGKSGYKNHMEGQ